MKETKQKQHDDGRNKNSHLNCKIFVNFLAFIQLVSGNNSRFVIRYPRMINELEHSYVISGVFLSPSPCVYICV